MPDLPKCRHDWVYQYGTKYIDLKYNATLTDAEIDAQVAAYRLKFNNIYNAYTNTMENRMTYNFDLLVIKYPNVREALIQLGYASPSMKYLKHVNSEDLYGKNVCGILPHSLSHLCASFTEIHIKIPGRLRGRELTVDEVKKYLSPLNTYEVTKL